MRVIHGLGRCPRMRLMHYATLLVVFLLAVAGNASAGGLPVDCVHDFGPFC